MKIKNKLITLALLSFSVLASAQEMIKEDNGEKIIPAKANWYIEVGGGAQVFFGRDASLIDFSDRITPSVTLTVGKWFSPYYGVRLQGGGYSLNGFSKAHGLYTGNILDNGNFFGPEDPVRGHVEVRPDGSYRYFLRYMNLHADFQFSLVNLFGGYRPERKWDIIPAVGLGYMHLFPYKGTSDENSLSANFSVMGKVKLPKGFDINLEVQSTVLPDRFDGRITDKACENSLVVGLGITYNFRYKGYKKNYIKVPEKDFYKTLSEYIQREIQQGLEDKTVERHTTDTLTLVKTVEKTIKTRTEPIRLASIRFSSEKYIPMDAQEVQFVNIAEYVNKHSNVSLLVEGYADRQTGPEDFNRKLSLQRAEKVRDILIEKYGIKADRIKIDAYGSSVQLYQHDSWNRVVVVTAIEE
ncbi:OmpA family protein [Bacteroides sp.]